MRSCDRQPGDTGAAGPETTLREVLPQTDLEARVLWTVTPCAAMGGASGRQLVLCTHSEIQAGWAWSAAVVMDSQQYKRWMLDGLTPF